METVVKVGFAQISLAAQKKSELPEIWEGGECCSLLTPTNGCYHLFFQSNTEFQLNLSVRRVCNLYHH